jgi:hypothetical protein
MTRVTRTGLAAAAVGIALAAAGAATPARALCVGGPQCYSTVQAALDVAANGDTIRIAPGTYAGGLVIVKSVDLVGGGASSTVISGGGPVVTIGSVVSTPTVSLTGLTVTGGLATADPQAPNCGPDVPTCGPGYTTATALGGGIEAFPGTTVTIRSSVVTGNRARPSTVVPSVKAKCPGSVPCPASFGDAAGIDNWGTMTIQSSTVSDNHAEGSQSNGGGIADESGASLTIRDSLVSGNSATASAAFTGRFVSGGGIFVDGGAEIDVENSTIQGNSANLVDVLPHPYPLQGGGTDQANAQGGGVFLSDGSSGSFRNSSIDGNTVSVDGPTGEPFGVDAALCACGDVQLSIENSEVKGNTTRLRVLSTTDSGQSGGILEADGSTSLRNTHVTGNEVDIETLAGDAQAIGTLMFFPPPGEGATLQGGSVSGNTVTARATGGAATIQGVGITNDGPLTLANSEVLGNTGTATGQGGFVQGGGIWNGLLFGGPESPLTLQNTHVQANSLLVSAGLTAAGGGIFTVGFPVTLDHAVVARNAPDDCAGC